jgi:hypothetical protein
MKLMDKKILILVTLLSMTGCNVATEVDSMNIQISGNKDIEFLKNIKFLRTRLIAKLRDADKKWKTLPIASAIKLWGENKFLVTEPTFSEVEAHLKKGENREAMAVFDNFIVVSTATSRVKVTI